MQRNATHEKRTRMGQAFDWERQFHCVSTTVVRRVFPLSSIVSPRSSSSIYIGLCVSPPSLLTSARLSSSLSYTSTCLRPSISFCFSLSVYSCPSLPVSVCLCLSSSSSGPLCSSLSLSIYLRQPLCGLGRLRRSPLQCSS